MKSAVVIGRQASLSQVELAVPSTARHTKKVTEILAQLHVETCALETLCSSTSPPPRSKIGGSSPEATSAAMSAANFAPFEAPPDEKRQSAPLASSSSAAAAPPRAPPTVPRTTLADEEDEDDLDPRYATESYQSSYPASASAPFLGSASAGQPSRPYSGGGGAGSYRDGFPHGATPTWAASAPAQQQYNLRPDHSSYSTSQGWSLSNLCFAAWALPPFSSVLMLIFETENVSCASLLLSSLVSFLELTSNIPLNLSPSIHSSHVQRIWPDSMRTSRESVG